MIQALEQYQGTFIVISHDRFFVENVATKIWYIEDFQLKEYPRHLRRVRAVAGRPREGRQESRPAQPFGSQAPARRAARVTVREFKLCRNENRGCSQIKQRRFSFY
ncbi:hypothetical protein [Hymenobacter sp. B1770]|uniref:hypothetical protein n=1 Tax=Hymenobacter sp. B1770 TaxID=1718788 RepID=UPI003CF9A74E